MKQVFHSLNPTSDCLVFVENVRFGVIATKTIYHRRQCDSNKGAGLHLRYQGCPAVGCSRCVLSRVVVALRTAVPRWARPGRGMNQPAKTRSFTTRGRTRLWGLWQPPRSLWKAPRSLWKAPRNLRQPPRSLWQPRRSLWKAPRNLRQPPRSLWKPPRNLRQPRRSLWKPPRDFRQPPRDLRQPPVPFGQPLEIRRYEPRTGRDARLPPRPTWAAATLRGICSSSTCPSLRGRGTSLRAGFFRGLVWSTAWAVVFRRRSGGRLFRRWGGIRRGLCC